MMKNKKKIEGNVIAEGEATGHAHRVIGPVQLYQGDAGTILIEAKAKTRLRIVHEEHRDMKLPSKINRSIIKRQYDAEHGWIRVAD